jgi:hypothetical protein
VRDITHNARFGPDDPVAQILDDLICPACGNRHPGDAFPSITSDTVRMFCDCCGAFVTISLTEAQAAALRRGARG